MTLLRITVYHTTRPCRRHFSAIMRLVVLGCRLAIFVEGFSRHATFEEDDVTADFPNISARYIRFMRALGHISLPRRECRQAEEFHFRAAGSRR